MGEDDRASVLVKRPESWMAIVVLNREEVRNAISTEMADQLVKRLNELATDVNLRVVMLIGAGDRAFSAGADLKQRHRMTPGQRQRHTKKIREVADLLAEFPVPVVAAIRGYATAGGAELAIACDLRVAGESAFIGFPEVRVGIFPGAGAIERLPRLVGASRARSLLFSGRQIEADQALQFGLIDFLVPDEYVIAEATHLCRDIASKSPAAIRALKQAILASERHRDDQAAKLVEAIRSELDSGAEYDEGLSAFVEKRAPSWKLND
jgi:enoyl-CoA hydratase/carnithine racemase